MPPASFRFQLTMDTLALGYVIPAIRAYSGLPPVRQCSCRAYKKAGTPRGNPSLLYRIKTKNQIKKRLSAYLAPSTMWSITNARAEAPTNMTAAIVINVIILITFSFLCFFNFLITTPCGRPFFFPLARCYLNYNLLVFRRCKGTKSVLCAQTAG